MSEMPGTAAPKSDKGGGPHAVHVVEARMDATPSYLVGDEVNAEAIGRGGREEIDVRTDDFVEDKATVRQVSQLLWQGRPWPLNCDA